MIESDIILCEMMHGGNNDEIFQIKITLIGYTEEVSRTILVPTDIDFEELHQNIQKAMGLENEHLYAFKVREDKIQPDDSLDINELDAGESIYSQINTLLRKGDTFEYLYDMDDGWKHTIEVEDTIEFTSKKPIVLESIGECPKGNSR